jgi:hypothetical protein
MDEAKRFGKISIDHLRQLIAFVPILEQTRPELAALMAEKPDKAAQLLKQGVAWGMVYDDSLLEQLACFLVVAGLTDYVVDASKSADPIGEMLKLDDHPDYQEWDGGIGKQFEIHQLLGSLYGLIGSFECLVLYGYYINDLLALVREQDDDEALFKAIRVDPGVLTSATAAHRISCAVVRGEKEFFNSLRNALEGKTGDQARYLRKFRLLMQVLSEQGLLDRPTADIRSLVFELDVYADNPNAEKNLNELIRKFRKQKTISK